MSVLKIRNPQTGEFESIRTIRGEPGEKGDPFTYEDFTKEQLAALKGDPGSDANVTTENIKNALGYTPADAETVSQLSADMASKVTSPNVATVGQVIAVKAVDADGKPTEWEAIDPPEGGGGSADAVLYTAQTLTDEQKNQARTNIGSVGEDDFQMTLNGLAVSQKGSLKWDGVIGDRAYVSPSEDMYLVHVSDEVPTIMAGMPIATVGMVAQSEGAMSYAMPSEVMEMGEDGLYLVADGMATIVPYDNYTMYGLTFPKKGVYFQASNTLANGFDWSIVYVSALMIPGYTFAESGGGDVSKYFETSGVSDTLTWDGNTDGVAELIGAYRVYTGFVPESLLSQECAISFSNGTTAQVVLQKIPSDLLPSGIVYGTEGVTIIIEKPTAEGFNTAEPGVYFVKNAETGVYVNSLTIPGASFGGTEKLKAEYLPDGIGGSKPVVLYMGNPIENTGVDTIARLYTTENGAANDTESDRVTASQLQSFLDKGPVYVRIATFNYLATLYTFVEKDDYTYGILGIPGADFEFVTAEYVPPTT